MWITKFSNLDQKPKLLFMLKVNKSTYDVCVGVYEQWTLKIDYQLINVGIEKEKGAN